MHKPFLMGIAGGSGSGKTRFAHQLKEAFGEGVVEVFSLDNYYKPIEMQPQDEWGEANFDRPESFYREKLLEDLTLLKSGKDLKVPKYEFNIDRGGEQKYIDVRAVPVVIVEGIFTFHFSELSSLIDLKVFVDAPIWLMMKRRIERDEFERGYGDLKETLVRYERHVIPAFNEFVLPGKNYADLIVPNHDDFSGAVKVVSNHLKSVVTI